MTTSAWPLRDSATTLHARIRIIGCSPNVPDASGAACRITHGALYRLAIHSSQSKLATVMIADMTIAGVAIHRVFPSLRIARGIGLGALVLLVCTVLWIFLFQTPAPSNTHTVLAAQQTALANYVARDIDYKLAERSGLLTQMASRMPLALLDHPAQLRRWLLEQPHSLFTRGIAVTDSSGRTVAPYLQRSGHAPGHQADNDFLRSALSGSVSIGRPTRSLPAGEPVLPIAVPVKDAHGHVRAVLVGTTALHAPGFLSLTPQSANDESTDFWLVSPRDRLLLASTTAQQVLQPTPSAGSDAVLDRALDGFRGTEVHTKPDATVEITAIAPVPAAGWFVLARHTATVSRPPTSWATGITAGVVVALFLAGVGYVFFQRRTLVFTMRSWRKRRSPSTLPNAAYHDPLTGLPNTSLLADRLAQALARAQRSGARVGLLHINLDQFGALNERMGVDAGDTALTEIARRLAAIVRETDTLARLDGDAFAVLLGELDNAFEPAKIAACAVAAKCLDAVAPTLLLNAEPCQLKASVGIALGAGHTEADALQSAATRAMYHAKQVGGDRYFVAATDTMPANPAMASA